MQIHNYERPLILAGRAGLETVVRMLLTFPQVIKTIDEENRDFQTAFFEACSGGNANIIRLLLDSGADPETFGSTSECSDGLTPLMLAAVRGDESLLATLLSHPRVEPFAKDCEDRTALWWAASYGHNSVVKTFLTLEGSEIQAKRRSRNAIWVAAVETNISTFKLLFESGFCPYQIDSYEHLGIDVPMGILSAVAFTSRLTEETCAMRLKMVELLLCHGLDINEQDPDGMTPLFSAIISENISMIEFLLGRGADVNARDARNKTPIFAAISCGNESVAKTLINLLMNNRADLNVQDCRNETPLFVAIYKRYPNLPMFLVRDHDADPGHVNSLGLTALTYAAVWSKHTNVLRFLLADNRVKPHVQDKWGGTAWFWAQLNGFEKTAKILLESHPGPPPPIELGNLIRAFRTDPFMRNTLMPRASSVFFKVDGTKPYVRKGDEEVLKTIILIYPDLLTFRIDVKDIPYVLE